MAVNKYSPNLLFNIYFLKVTNIMFKYCKNILVFFMALVFISACGGGSGGGTSSPPAFTPGSISFDSKSGGVDSLTPASMSPIIVLKFSQAVNPSSVNAQNVVLRETVSQTAVALGSAFTPNTSNTEFTLLTAHNLLPSTQYTVAISSITLPNGASFNTKTLTLTFLTGSDKTPTVVLDTPGNNASNVNREPIIQVTFSTAVSGVNSSNVSLVPSDGTPSPAITITQTSDTKYSITIPQGQPLQPNTKYSLNFNNGIADTSGDTLASTVFNFTTGTAVNPIVTMNTPVNNATNVNREPIIQVMFNTAVSGVESSNVSLVPSDGTQPPVITITQTSDTTYYITTQQLKSNIQYSLNFNNRIVNTSGVTLTSTTFDFTTGASVTPIVTILPVNNEKTVSLDTRSITLQFNESVQNANITTVKLLNGSTAVTLLAPTVDTTGTIYKFAIESSALLSPGATYTVNVESGITDTSTTPVSLRATSSSFVTASLVSLGNSGGESTGTITQPYVLESSGTYYVAMESDNGTKPYMLSSQRYNVTTSTWGSTFDSYSISYWFDIKLDPSYGLFVAAKNSTNSLYDVYNLNNDGSKRYQYTTNGESTSWIASLSILNGNPLLTSMFSTTKLQVFTNNVGPTTASWGNPYTGGSFSSFNFNVSIKPVSVSSESNSYTMYLESDTAPSSLTTNTHLLTCGGGGGLPVSCIDKIVFTDDTSSPRTIDIAFDKSSKIVYIVRSLGVISMSEISPTNQQLTVFPSPTDDKNITSVKLAVGGGNLYAAYVESGIITGKVYNTASTTWSTVFSSASLPSRDITGNKISSFALSAGDDGLTRLMVVYQNSTNNTYSWKLYTLK